MYGEQARFFDDEIHPTIKHTRKGLVAMAGSKPFIPDPVRHAIAIACCSVCKESVSQ